VLTGIQDLLRKHGRLTLRELAVHFRMEVSAIEPMLDILAGKGRIRIVPAGCSKGSCTGCFCADREDMISYEIMDG
jgi:hypothetical protein